MFKENSVDNWILGGAVFLLIFTLGCYLWFQNEMAYLQPQDINVERQHLKKASETKQAEKPHIELTDTAQPDVSEKNSNDARDNANRNPSASHNNTPQEYIQSGIVAASLAVINSASEGL